MLLIYSNNAFISHSHPITTLRCMSFCGDHRATDWKNKLISISLCNIERNWAVNQILKEEDWGNMTAEI